MPPPGSLSRRPDAANIALACLNGDSSRDIAARFGTSKSAVDRYRKHADLSSAAAAAAAVVEPVEPVPVEAVPVGDAREVQLDVQRRLLVQFAYCEQHHDARGCALIAVQIRLNAEWLRADAEEAPDAEPPVLVTFQFPQPRSVRAALEDARAPEPEALAPATSAVLDAEAVAPQLPVVAPGSNVEPRPAEPAMLGPVRLSLGSYAVPRLSEDEP